MPRFLSAVLTLLLILQLAPIKQVSTASFNQTYIRLDTVTKSSHTGGVVCANPTSSSTEASVAITFPTGFNVNTTASNWTVNTTDLPGGTMAWPGIGTASSVSGQTVTFPSGDLSTGTLYCFHFASSNTLTNAATAESYEAIIQTKTGTSTVIDATSVALPVANVGEIGVTATVSANPNDFTTITESSDGAGPFEQGKVLNYQITYSSNANTAGNITLQAHWSEGTIQGNSSQSVSVLEYIVGSASNGYNNSAPVIDTTNRTITWTIPGFPANTSNQTVTFQLRTTSSYTGPSLVDFNVASHIETPTFVTADSTFSQQYRFSQGTPGPAASSEPRSSTTPSASSSPAARPSNNGGLIIQSVEVTQIANGSARIVVKTLQDTPITILYGENSQTLNQKITSAEKKKIHQFDLNGLKENQVYFFRLQYQDKSGKTINSELFTFKTASSSEVPQFDLSKILLVSSTSLNYPGLILDQNNPEFILPVNTKYEFKLPFSNYQFIKRITVSLDNSQVLGLSTIYAAELDTTRTSMIEVFPGIYSAKLKTPSQAGKYQMSARIEDFHGNIIERPVFTLQIVPLMHIQDKSNGKPIENAKISLSLYNPRLKLFENIENQGLDIQNPVFSDSQGEVSMVLPNNRYKAEITAPGYYTQSAEFTIAPGQERSYPLINLEPKPWNLVTAWEYYSAILIDFWNNSIAFISSLAQSSRLFQFMALVTLSTTGGLLLLVTSIRRGMDLGDWLVLPGHLFRVQNISNNITGLIVDKDNHSVAGAEVLLLNGSKIVKKAISGRQGNFSFPVRQSEAMLTIIKDGFLIHEKEWKGGPIKIVLEHDQHLLEKAEHFSLRTGLTLLDGLVETLLILSIVLELFFFRFLPPLYVAPFFLISILNLLIWGFTSRSQKLDL